MSFPPTSTSVKNTRIIRAPRGSRLTAKSWHAEGPLRMVMNNLDPDVAEHPKDLVGKWAAEEVFDELERKGLMMFGQMTAGSWTYVGSQGIIGGTFETCVAAGRQHYDGDLTGRWLLTAGLGGMGIGYSQHAGFAVVADGTPDAANGLSRVLANDSSVAVFRHADAGYPDALETVHTEGFARVVTGSKL